MQESIATLVIENHKLREENRQLREENKGHKEFVKRVESLLEKYKGVSLVRRSTNAKASGM